MKKTELEREERTLERMIRIYCRRHHGSGRDLCPECGELLEYSLERIRRCPLGERRTTCSRCPVHCYSPEKREAVRRIMRYSGPRMLFYHPLDALIHLWKEKKPSGKSGR